MMPLIGGLVPIPVVISMVADTALSLIRNVAVAGLVMAAADYAMQRRKVGKQTRMTKHEVKQEHKNVRGRPARQERDPRPASSRPPGTG